jgi:phosphatidate cytidylyltransferase
VPVNRSEVARMFENPSLFTLIAIFGLLSVARICRVFGRRRFFFDSYLSYTWLFFLTFVFAALVSFAVSVWILAIISFWAIREYFSLINIRLQDRLALVGAYLSIPFMYYFIQTEWYGMFIVSIPVYAFLAIPILVAWGGRESEGTVFSIGAIDFGLFLFVFCIGHVGYLLSYSVWMAVLLILNVMMCDLVICLVRRRTDHKSARVIFSWLAPIPVVLALSLALSPWTGIPPIHSIILALMTPVLVQMGHHVGRFVEADLGIQEDLLVPGRGQILDNLQSLFYVAPVWFHYIRYFLK